MPLFVQKHTWHLCLLPKHKEKSLEEALANRALDITLRDVKQANPDCQACEYFSVCGGGCRNSGYASSQILGKASCGKGKGDLLQKGPVLCAYFREGYYDKLRKLLQEYAERHNS